MIDPLRPKSRGGGGGHGGAGLPETRVYINEHGRAFNLTPGQTKVLGALGSAALGYVTNKIYGASKKTQDGRGRRRGTSRALIKDFDDAAGDPRSATPRSRERKTPSKSTPYQRYIRRLPDSRTRAKSTLLSIYQNRVQRARSRRRTRYLRYRRRYRLSTLRRRRRRY